MDEDVPGRSPVCAPHASAPCPTSGRRHRGCTSLVRPRCSVCHAITMAFDKLSPQEDRLPVRETRPAAAAATGPAPGAAAPLVRLWAAIPPRRRVHLLALLAFTLVASLAEVFSIGAVLPFLGVLTAPERVFAHEYAQPFIARLGITQPQDLLLLATVLFCASALVAAVIRIVAIRLRTRMTFATGADLSVEVYRRTLYQPYTVHLARNSSEVIDGISGKVNTVIFSVLGPLMIIVSNALMLTAILAALLIYQPVVALVTFAGFGLIYLVIYRSSRARLQANSRRVASSSTQRIKSLQEGLGGIRDVLLDNTQAVYCAEYRSADRRLRRAQAGNIITVETPRFAIEGWACASSPCWPLRWPGSPRASLPRCPWWARWRSPHSASCRCCSRSITPSPA